jgi:hypothetical protein
MTFRLLNTGVPSCQTGSSLYEEGILQAKEASEIFMSSTRSQHRNRQTLWNGLLGCCMMTTSSMPQKHAASRSIDLLSGRRRANLWSAKGAVSSAAYVTPRVRGREGHRPPRGSPRDSQILFQLADAQQYSDPPLPGGAVPPSSQVRRGSRSR